MTNPMNHILNRFPKLRVTVVGDAMLDAYVRGHVDRVCREAPVPVVTVSEREYYCGGAANTAVNVASLGGETSFISVIGRDENGYRLCRLLREKKVDISGVIRDECRSTLTKTRVTADSAILVRTDEGSVEPIGGQTENLLIRQVSGKWGESDVIILSDYEYGPFTERIISMLAELRRSSPVTLLVDSKWPGKFRSLRPDGVKPNYEEFLQLTGLQPLHGEDRIDQVIDARERVKQLTGARLCVITLDAQGVVLIDDEGNAHHFPVKPREAKNTVGAGDTFISALALALGAEAPPRRAIRIACTASRIVVEREETACCTLRGLKEAQGGKYFRDPQLLAERLKELKNRGKHIVFANGCFDLLHPGHIGFLHRARQLGDILVVGLNTDESVRRIKGANRPVTTLRDRITLLSALQSVNYITSFDEDDACRLIRRIEPDVLVKGSDHSPERIPEAVLMEEMGKETKIVSVHINRSVTGMISKIRNGNNLLAA